MSKVCYGDDYIYAGTRIIDTLVMTEDQRPLYIVYRDGKKFLGQDVMSKEESYYDLEDLDFTPHQLGFVNIKKGTTFTSRSPARHYRQGLCPNNFQSWDYMMNPFNQQVYKTILGIFPSCYECYELVKSGFISQAFSRNFRLIRGDMVSLDFRGETVGTVSPNHDTGNVNYVLSDDFSFLQEMLEEEIHVQQ